MMIPEEVFVRRLVLDVICLGWWASCFSDWYYNWTKSWHVQSWRGELLIGLVASGPFIIAHMLFALSSLPATWAWWF